MLLTFCWSNQTSSSCWSLWARCLKIWISFYYSLFLSDVGLCAWFCLGLSWLLRWSFLIFLHYLFHLIWSCHTLKFTILSMLPWQLVSGWKFNHSSPIVFLTSWAGKSFFFKKKKKEEHWSSKVRNRFCTENFILN